MAEMSQNKPLLKMPTMQGHSHHNMADNSPAIQEKSEDDCCTEFCSCLSGTCSNVAVLIKYSASQLILLNTSLKIPSHTQDLLSPQPASLYRPPVLS